MRISDEVGWRVDCELLPGSSGGERVRELMIGRGGAACTRQEASALVRVAVDKGVS